MGRRQAEAAGPLDVFRRFFALQWDVLVPSLAMFAFSLGLQMTKSFPPGDIIALGAGVAA